MTPEEPTLIGIDGPDGSGKKTQTDLLVERTTREIRPATSWELPDYPSWTGKIIRNTLDGMYGDPDALDPYVASMLFAADRLRIAPTIRAALAEGKHGFLNRWKFANDGHQGGKIDDPVARKAFWEWGDRLEFDVNRIPRPVLSIYLCVPIDVSLRLLEARAKESGKPMDGHENRKHLEGAIRSYTQLASTYDDFVLVDCGTPDGQDILPKEVIHEMVWAVVKPLLTA